MEATERTICPTCGHPAEAPYRHLNNEGHISEGCIDGFHTGHLYGESAAWHNSTFAKAHRQFQATRLAAILAPSKRRA